MKHKRRITTARLVSTNFIIGSSLFESSSIHQCSFIEKNIPHRNPLAFDSLIKLINLDAKNAPFQMPSIPLAIRKQSPTAKYQSYSPSLKAESLSDLPPSSPTACPQRHLRPQHRPNVSCSEPLKLSSQPSPAPSRVCHAYGKLVSRREDSSDQRWAGSRSRLAELEVKMRARWLWKCCWLRDPR